MVNVMTIPIRFDDGRPKPHLAVKLAPYLQQGFADCFDVDGRLFAQIPCPHGKIPPGTREIGLSYEDYFNLRRSYEARGSI